MNLRFVDPGIEYSINSIMMFQTEEVSDWWSESLFHFFPQLDAEKFSVLNQEEKNKYLATQLQAVYQENKEEITQKATNYQAYWDQNKQQIEEAFSDAFGLDASKVFNDIVVNITLNPVSPRFLEEHVFDVFYLNSEKGALGLSLHELTHFIWFFVWHQHFQDSYSEYEMPDLKWVLSEMVVETIMHDQRLAALNPYYEHHACVYDYFYKMQIDGKLILDTLYKMYQNNSITAFMEASIEYCRLHEGKIREQME